MTAPSPPGSTSPASTGPTALDAAALARLRQLDPQGTNQVVQRVMTAFEASLQRMLTQLAQQVENESPQALMELAHGMKSSSASVGALALSQACAEVERRIRDGAPGELRADVDKLAREASAVVQAVRAMLQG